MQQGANKNVDVINGLLEDCLLAFPVSGLLISLYQQYQKRGFLTKKQMQGLHAKASQVKDIAPPRLATLEAMIKRLPDRYRSPKPDASPLYEKDTEAEALILALLEKAPHHKRVLFLKSKLDHHEPLSAAELAELKKFLKLFADRENK